MASRWRPTTGCSPRTRDDAMRTMRRSWFASARSCRRAAASLLKVASFLLPLAAWCVVSYVPVRLAPDGAGHRTRAARPSCRPARGSTGRCSPSENANARRRRASRRRPGDPANPIFLPAPHEVARAFYTAFTTPPRRKGDPWLHESLAHSCRSSSGLPALGRRRRAAGHPVRHVRVVSRLVEPFVDFVRYMPPPVFGALAVAVLGIDDGPKIAIIFIGTFFQMVRVVANTTRLLDPALLEAAQTLGASRQRLVTRVIVPGILPNLYNDLRILLGCAVDAADHRGADRRHVRHQLLHQPAGQVPPLRQRLRRHRHDRAARAGRGPVAVASSARGCSRGSASPPRGFWGEVWGVLVRDPAARRGRGGAGGGRHRRRPSQPAGDAARPARRRRCRRRLSCPSYLEQDAGGRRRGSAGSTQRPVVLEVRDLGKALRRADGEPVEALRDVSFNVHRREFVCVIGPSRLRQVHARSASSPASTTPTGGAGAARRQGRHRPRRRPRHGLPGLHALPLADRQAERHVRPADQGRRRNARPRPTRCSGSRWSASRSSPTPTRTSSPAACGSASRSPRRWPTSRGSC